MLTQYQEYLKELNIILASKSAGRKKLLESLNAFNFNIFPSDFEEDLDKKLFNTAIEYNRATCQGKVNDLLPRLEKEGVNWDIVIFADTICHLNGNIIEKPESKEAVSQMMRDFSEKWHQVYTCVHVVARRKSDGKLIDKEFVETSEVLIGKMSEISIQHWANIEDNWKGRAGGYQLQGSGLQIIQSIKGCSSNIIGLPIYMLCKTLCEVVEFLQQ